MIVTGERVAKFVSDRLDFGLCPPYTAVGIEKNHQIVAGVLFNCFEGADVHISVAGKGWTRGFLNMVGVYVYEQLCCERMTVLTEQADVVDLAIRLGGEIEGRLRNHFGYGRDGTIVGILSADWRYAIRERN